MLTDLLKGESGTNAVEYGLLMALIVLGIIGAMQAFSSAVNTSLYAVTASLFSP